MTNDEVLDSVCDGIYALVRHGILNTKWSIDDPDALFAEGTEFYDSVLSSVERALTEFGV